MATQKQVAEHLGVSTRTIRHLEARGVLPPRQAGGAYDVDACRHTYLERLREQAAGREGAGLTEARAQLAKAERVELEVQILRNKYVSQEEIARQLEAAYAVVNDKLHCVAPLAAARIGGSEEERIRDAVNAEVIAAICELRKPYEIIQAALNAQEGGK